MLNIVYTRIFTILALISMSADLYFTSVSSLFLSFSFFLSLPNLRGRWTELSENRPYGRNVRNLGYPFPYKLGAQKPPFWTNSQLNNKRLQTWPAFLPTLCKFRIPLHCQASQTEISKRNSTKLCQVMGIVALTNCRRKVGVVPPTKIRGQKTFAFARFFDDFKT